MVLRTRRLESALDEKNNKINKINQVGPAPNPKVSHVKEVLLTLKARLETQIHSGDDEHGDPEAHAVLRTVRRRLNQVDSALRRIEEGKYGTCLDCSKTIERDRMTLQPFSTRCTSCQTVADWQGLNY
jgi:DnaK suppressor protein